MMMDQFDKDLFSEVLKDPNVLIYSKERTMTKISPSMVYLPNKAVMFKIMRACLDTYYIDDLWINFKE